MCKLFIVCPAPCYTSQILEACSRGMDKACQTWRKIGDAVFPICELQYLAQVREKAFWLQQGRHEATVLCVETSIRTKLVAKQCTPTRCLCIVLSCFLCVYRLASCVRLMYRIGLILYKYMSCPMLKEELGRCQSPEFLRYE